MFKPLKTALVISCLSATLPVFAGQCDSSAVKLQVLGSGGPQLNDNRASSGYLIWVDGKATVLIDTGPGSSINFGKAGANFKDLEGILLSHLHVDHSSDLPAYIKGSFFSDRIEDMKLLGPKGNDIMPPITDFIQSMFGEKGAYPYLSGYFVPYGRNYTVEVIGADIESDQIQNFQLTEDIKLSAVAVHHGPLPAVAWRVDVKGCSITFSGDMSGQRNTLQKLAAGSDILVAHHAVPEGARGGAAHLHMRPSKIGEIAAQAKVKQLVLSHRMSPSIGKEQQSLAEIKKQYAGKVSFADDLDSYKP